MNVIICGAGKVGFSISKQLAAQGHSISVIDQSSEDIKKINDTQDVKGIVGRATLPSVLENAGAEKADMIIAVTKNDETNMIVCQLASSLFNISRDGNNFFFVSIAIAICIAVGKTSFVDWDLLTWSLGCTGLLVPFFPPKISIACWL